MPRRVLAAAALVLLPLSALAQTPAPAASPNPATAAVKSQFATIKDVLARTAAKVPENLYAFKPTPEVRTIGQLIGHIADSQYLICSGAAGEKAPRADYEKTMTTKADLSKALADSSAYCDKVIDSMNDMKGMEIVRFGGPTPRLHVLTFNIAHSYEHYGNLVTYMRIKGIVPPSSTPRQPPAEKKK
jgi:uncharacterized damage-inducible protein DinB